MWSRTALTVLRYVYWLFGVAVEETENVGWWRCVDDRRCDQLVHRLVVCGVRGVVDEASTTCVDTARQEGHAQRLVVRDTL